MYLIGIDVGGTNTKFGMIEDGKIVKSFTISTNTFDIIRQLVNGIKELVQSMGKTLDDVSGIAVGFPGMIINDILKDSPNIGLSDCNLAELLSNELGKSVIVKNDAEMAVMAEHKLGAGNNCNNMIMLTIGTGVGGGIIINKQLYTGNGGAGELGHIVVNKNGLKCKCGRTGCAEQYISLSALDRITRDLIVGYPDSSIKIEPDKMVDACDLVKAYKKNDSCAIEVVQRYVAELSSFVLNLCNMFRPEKIVIGGGLTYAPEIIQMVAKVCKEQEFGYKDSPNVEIVSSQLGNEAGILGAIVCCEEVGVQSKPNISELTDVLQEISEVKQEVESETDEEMVVETSEDDAEEIQSEEISQFDETLEDIQEKRDVSGVKQTFDLFKALTDASVSSENAQDSTPVEYDEGLLDRVNEMLKRK
ncbi:MAG: ROK family protein [Clostridia bacterium]|nr:ROK family protein [Clostridia bacterium]